MIQKALEIAQRAHAGQFDKGGNPYIGHPLAVAEMVDTEEEKIVAFLHDVVEDSAYTLDDISNLGFIQDIVAAICSITKQEGEPYNAYIQRVKASPMAVKVKIADMTHNMDLTRISNPTEKDYLRIARYEEKIKDLKDYLNQPKECTFC